MLSADARPPCCFVRPADIPAALKRGLKVRRLCAWCNEQQCKGVRVRAGFLLLADPGPCWPH